MAVFISCDTETENGNRLKVTIAGPCGEEAFPLAASLCIDGADLGHDCEGSDTIKF